MSLLAKLKRWFSRPEPAPLDQWFFVSFDDRLVKLRADPPGQEGWEQSFPWQSIERVCFKDEGPLMPDGIYVFTAAREESFVVPVEANGGTELLSELTGRGYLPDSLLADAMSSTDGGLYCWPPLEKEDTGA